MAFIFSSVIRSRSRTLTYSPSMIRAPYLISLRRADLEVLTPRSDWRLLLLIDMTGRVLMVKRVVVRLWLWLPHEETVSYRHP